AEDSVGGRGNTGEPRGNLADRELAGARNFRYVWHFLQRTSGYEAHSSARGVAGASAAQGLRHFAAGHRLGPGKFGDRERAVAAQKAAAEEIWQHEPGRYFARRRSAK